MVDSISQTFQLNYSSSISVPGTYLTSIGVFFQSKSPTLGVRMIVCGTTNGYPDGSKIIGSGYLNANQVNVSDDSSAETKFTFAAPIMLNNNTLYAFIIVPDGGNPYYNVFVSELGGTDYLSGSYIGKQIYSGTLFTTSNQTTFVPISTSEIKFNLYRAKFNTRAGTLILRNQKTDYLTLTGYQRANTANPLQLGDIVYAANSADTNQILSNTSVYPFGQVFALDEANQKVTLINTNGNFNKTTYPVLKFFRVSQPGNTSLLSNTNLIASANLYSIDDLNYHSLVPKLTFSEPSGTSVSMLYYGTANALSSYALDNYYEGISNEQRYDFNDYERTILSYSNEKQNGSFGANGSATIVVNMLTNSPYASPVFDLSTKTIDYISNQINYLYDNESTRYGDALNKYISLPVSMTQTADDLKVFTIAYRPPGTEIQVYVRFRNNHDTALISDNPWALLNMDPTQVSTYSSSKNINDFVEYDFYVPIGNTVPNQTIAYMDPNADLGNGVTANAVTYYSSSGTHFTQFDNFAIKIVLLSQNQVIIPRVKSISAIAMLQ